MKGEINMDREKDHSAVIGIIQEILSWNDTDYWKHYFIRSFLFGWTSEEQIHNLTNSKARG